MLPHYSVPTIPTSPPSVCLQDRSSSPDDLNISLATPRSQQNNFLQIDHGIEHRCSSSLSFTDASTLAPAGEIACPAGVTAEPSMLQQLRPIAPSHVRHYERGVIIENNHGPWVVKPIEMFKFADVRKQYPAPWKCYVHPEGNPYFSCNDEAHSRRFRYLTEANPYTHSVREELDECMDAIESKAKDLELSQVSSKVDAVLELQDEQWCYYLIDVDRRAVFWLDEYDTRKIVPPDEGFEMRHQLCHKLEYEYWQHIEYFPISAPKDTEELYDELMDTLEFYNLDCVTSRDSTVPYSKDDLQSIIGSVKHLRLSNLRRRSDHAIVALARMASIIESQRHLNFYGFEGARLVFDQSVRGNSSNKRSWLVKCLSPMLFYSPNTYLDNIELICVDGVIRLEKWKMLYNKLEKDWSGIVLSSTVLLNANVAFLAIPNVSSDENAQFWSSPAAAASLVSTVASLMCIIIGLLLGRQLRIGARGDEGSANDAMKYLQRRRHRQLGMETLAIQYSLPYALLMWGFLAFTAAIAIICFYEVDATPNLATRMVYTIVWFFFLLLVVWTVLTGWESSSGWRGLTSKDWWIGHITGVAAWPWRRLRGLMGRAKGEAEDDVELGNTGSAIDDATDPPLRVVEETRLRMRFGPVRHLTKMVLRRPVRR